MAGMRAGARTMPDQGRKIHRQEQANDDSLTSVFLYAGTDAGENEKKRAGSWRCGWGQLSADFPSVPPLTGFL